MRAAPLLLFLMVFSACATPRIELMRQIPAARPPAVTPDLTVSTWNGGLAPGLVRYARQRTPLTAAEAAATKADVVCLQEFWTDDSRDALLRSLNLPPDRVYAVDTAGMGESGQDRCEPGQADGMLGCAREKCAGLPEEELADCVAANCKMKALWLYLTGRRCLNCLVATVGKGVDEILKTCYGRGASRLYGGRNGVVMFSRYPLANRETVILPSSGANRVALLATARVRGREIELACTHLSTRQALSPTHPRFNDWADEMRAQFRQISDRLAARAGGSRSQLLVGDLNFGQRHDPVNNDVMWDVWKAAADLGWVSPAEYAKPPICSWCKGNTLSGAGSNTLIDHVMVRNPPRGGLEPVAAYSVHREQAEYTGWKGERVRTHLSDHFGIVVEFVFR
jgi:endonuclease/exonuclease/phosphatase family metal-dependent hydrolase